MRITDSYQLQPLEIMKECPKKTCSASTTLEISLMPGLKLNIVSWILENEDLKSKMDAILNDEPISLSPTAQLILGRSGADVDALSGRPLAFLQVDDIAGNSNWPLEMTSSFGSLVEKLKKVLAEVEPEEEWVEPMEE